MYGVTPTIENERLIEHEFMVKFILEETENRIFNIKEVSANERLFSIRLIVLFL